MAPDFRTRACACLLDVMAYIGWLAISKTDETDYYD